MLRQNFHRDREMLTALCRAAADATQQFYRCGLGRDDVSVGLVLHPQLFGDKLNFHPHLHGICTDGAFDTRGNFHRLPIDMQDDITVLQKLFERNVLDFMVERGRISQRLRDDMLLNWKHTGFSADASVRILQGDDEGLRRLVRYIARPPVSFERVTYDDRRGTVTIRSVRKINGERPVVATYDVLTFLALLALQVPPPGTHFTRYYGYYSTRSRAERRQAEQTEQTDAATSGKSAPAQIDPPCAKARRRSWAELLRLVFEVDPRCASAVGDCASCHSSRPRSKM